MQLQQYKHQFVFVCLYEMGAHSNDFPYFQKTTFISANPHISGIYSNTSKCKGEYETNETASLFLSPCSCTYALDVLYTFHMFLSFRAFDCYTYGHELRYPINQLNKQ